MCKRGGGFKGLIFPPSNNSSAQREARSSCPLKSNSKSSLPSALFLGIPGLCSHSNGTEDEGEGGDEFDKVKLALRRDGL